MRKLFCQATIGTNHIALQFQTSEITLKTSSKCLALNNLTLLSPSSHFLLLFRDLCETLPSASFLTLTFIKVIFLSQYLTPPWEILLSLSCLWLTNRYSPLQIIPVCSNPECLSAYASFPLKCPTGTYNKACSNLNSPTNLPFIVLSINERYHHTLSSRGRKLLCLLFLLHSPLPQLYPTSMSCKLSLPNISRIPLLRSTHREVPAMAILN